MLQILYRDSLRPGPWKEEKVPLKLQMESKPNLISISHLDKDGFECHFGHDKCAIWCNNACVGIAYLHDELYLLSLHENLIPCVM
jgi:hypothetical protein